VSLEDAVQESSGAAPPDPEELEAQAGPAHSEISPLARPGAVELTVSDLERSVDYYRTAVGLEPLESGKATLRSARQA
jgi:catechol-2,3-dioxygenase